MKNLQFLITNTKSVIKDNNFFAIVAIILTWLVSIIIVNPFGNFPLNDDWVYAKAAKSIYETGRFSLEGGNTGTNIILQSLYGSLFLYFDGFSFTALRFSTLLAGLVGVIGSYFFFKECKISNLNSLFGALLIFYNPIYFSMSFTFMTDVHYYVMFIFSILFFLRYINNPKRMIYLFLGISFTIASILIRQTGILTFISIAVFYIYKYKFTYKSVIIASVFLLLAVLTQYLYMQYLNLLNQQSPNLSFSYLFTKQMSLIDNNPFESIKRIFEKIYISSFRILEFISLLYLPLIMITYYKIISFSKNKFKVLLNTLVIGSIILLSIKLLNINIFELLGNILNYYGIGPLTLHDTYILKINLPVTNLTQNILWHYLVMIGLISMVLFLYIIKFYIFSKDKFKNIFIFSLFFTILISITFANSTFDRYALCLFPLTFAIILNQIGKFKEEFVMKAQFILSILFLSVISIVITHDYMAWNRARWEILNRLVTVKSISPREIDGGYEFNGWYLYNKDDIYSTRFKQKPGSNKSWWYIIDDKYMITAGPVKGYKVVEISEIPTFSIISIQKILLLERN